MELGYILLAESLIADGHLEDAFRAIEKISDRNTKIERIRQIRNKAAKSGRFDLYKRASESAGLELRFDDLMYIFLVNVIKQSLDGMLEVLDQLPDSETTVSLIDTAIIISAHHGHIVICERLAERRGRALTKDEAAIAKLSCIREGWLTDAKRAAEVEGVELSEDDYRIMFIANKDKGLLSEAIQTAKQAGKAIDTESLIGLLLAAIRSNRSTAWNIADMFDAT